MRIVDAQPDSDPRVAYQALRDQGAVAVRAGRYEEALELFEGAFGLAQQIGDEALVDRAFCNRSGVEIELGRGAAAVPQLRQILVRNQDAENCRLAAYHIAESYKLRKQYKKALFYARISLDRSQNLERTDWIASSHNSIGNILLAESYFDQACAEYEAALALSDSAPSVWRALILDNVGYCRIVAGRYQEGFGLLYDSLRTLRRFGADRFQAVVHLDLCFAHLELRRFADAWRHGHRALALGPAAGGDTEKNALYLLGEVANLAGDDQRAQDYFSRLQRFYPDAPFLTDFLLAIDVRKVINLKA